MAKLMRVHKARETTKKRVCYRCGVPIPAGVAYSWIGLKTGPRSSETRNFCDQHPPRSSEMTANSRLTTLYSAQETALDEISAASTSDDIAEALRSAADTVEEVAEEYRDSVQNMPENLQHGSQAQEMEEQADSLSDWASTLSSLADDIAADPADDPDLSGEDQDDKLDQQKTDADDALNVGWA